jgi:hypothetical protein
VKPLQGVPSPAERVGQYSIKLVARNSAAIGARAIGAGLGSPIRTIPMSPNLTLGCSGSGIVDTVIKTEADSLLLQIFSLFGALQYPVPHLWELPRN